MLLQQISKHESPGEPPYFFCFFRHEDSSTLFTVRCNETEANQFISAFKHQVLPGQFESVTQYLFKHEGKMGYTEQTIIEAELPTEIINSTKGS